MPNITLVHRVGILALSWCAVAFLFMAPTTAPAYAQSAETAIQDITAFEQATQAYVLMHRRLERQIGSIQFGTPIDEIDRIIRELAVAIRAERAEAGQGDLFTPALARLLRTRINEALLDHGYTADEVRAAGRVEGVDYGRVKLLVNDSFPWALAAAMFPCVTEALPPLPPELQYRIVGDDLMLVDVHAGLIVDILPRALTDLTAREPRP